MTLLYNIAMLIYQSFIWLASKFNNNKATLFLSGRENVFALLEQKRLPGERYVWFHAASLGEFEQGRPIMESLKNSHPEFKILLTFFSPSGYEVRKDYQGADIICYLPMDMSWNVKRFLDIVQPDCAIFIKYEFWMNYLLELKKRQIKTYIVSAIFRESQLFFRSYGGFYRRLLKSFSHLFVQNDESVRLLHSIGVDNVTKVGDTRFDRVADIAAKSKDLPIVQAFKSDAKVLIAGSSWPNDENILLPFFNQNLSLKLIIAPHEIDEGHLQSIISQLKRPYVRYSQATIENVKEVDCLIIDCFGLLSSIYRYGEIAYVGGGFGVGIHNILEAAVYGIPVVFGPNFRKFQEAVDLHQEGGAFVVDSYESFSQIMSEFLEENSSLYSSACKVSNDYSQANKGATSKVVNAIFNQR
ncbi:MAG: glycosyltransferase N-terminal domain-containing protein [Paludibacteraceae bacterium]|jgi:3-deoxy-D-manno-octulosonic-acid transferase|nr:3-deoxy-D-manno-octulosonic acid transferase [Paludibacteraceae bacterium]MEE0910941.1 glycosyltransferase N-terminal domain-containing protein [Paludibacteraceae bacterium]